MLARAIVVGEGMFNARQLRKLCNAFETSLGVENAEIGSKVLESPLCRPPPSEVHKAFSRGALSAFSGAARSSGPPATAFQPRSAQISNMLLM